MDLVSLCGVSIMSDYSDKSMVSRDDAADDIDDDDGAHDLVYTTMLMLLGKWYVFVLKTITCNTSLARREC
jgi:hypothetical protein